MRFFVTGATGFIGAHVVHKLLEDGGHQVAVLVRPTSDLWRLQPVLPALHQVEGGLEQIERLTPLLSAFRPDVVLHLAWRDVGGRHACSPDQLQNVTDSLNLVRAAHAAGARRWIGLGSQAEYGPCCGPISETQPLRPTTFYGAAKVAAANMAELFCRDLGLEFTWLRLFSAYGPMDNPRWLIPSTILGLLGGQRLSVTAGEQLWDFLYATDAAAAIVATTKPETAPGTYNLGSGTVIPIHQCLEQLRELVDPQGEIGFGDRPYQPGQVMHLQADIRKLQQAADWFPQVTLQEGLPQTVAWFRRHSSASSPHNFMANSKEAA